MRWKDQTKCVNKVYVCVCVYIYIYIYPPPRSASARLRVMASPFEASQPHSDISHSVGLLWTSDKPDAETSTWMYTTLTKKISMPPVGFEPAIPASADLRLRRRGLRDRQIYINHSCYTCCYNGAINTWPVLFYRATQVSRPINFWRQYSLSPFGRCPRTVRVPYTRTNSREIDCAKTECRKKVTVRGKHGSLKVRVPSFQQRTREDSPLLATWNFSTLS
jgi:hypothetical protein